MRSEVLTTNQFDCCRLTGDNIINEQLPITNYPLPITKYETFSLPNFQSRRQATATPTKT